jgi:hypothetical protein
VIASTMKSLKTLTIQISSEDWKLLETEADKNKVSTDLLVSQILSDRLSQMERKAKILRALQSLYEIGERQQPVDAVRVAAESREHLEHRGLF